MISFKYFIAENIADLVKHHRDLSVYHKEVAKKHNFPTKQLHSIAKDAHDRAAYEHMIAAGATERNLDDHAHSREMANRASKGAESRSKIANEDFLEERASSIGFNPKQEHHREKHRQQIHDILKQSYSHPSLGGYSGLGSGSSEESKAIHSDISNSLIKAIKRNDKITAVNLYKDKHGRKTIATGTDGTVQGKLDWKKLYQEDDKHKRSWAEVSGAVEHILHKMGTPKVSADRAKHLTGKDDIRKSDDSYHYTRKIGNSYHEKIIMGHPKD